MFRNWDIETMNEVGDAFLRQFLFLVRGIACFGCSKSKSFYRLRKNDRRSTSVFDGALVCVEDFDGIVSATMQREDLVVRHVADEFKKFGILAKEFLTNVGAALCLEGLVIAVDALFHTL